MFGARLRELRRAREMSQLELSKILGVVQQTVGMWETNKTAPNYDILKKISAYFGVTTDYLLGNVRHEKEVILSDEQSALLTGFEKLPMEGRKECLDHLDYLKHKYEKTMLSSLAAPMSGVNVTENNFAG